MPPKTTDPGVCRGHFLIPISIIAGWTQLTCQMHLIDYKMDRVIWDLTCDFAEEIEEIYFQMDVARQQQGQSQVAISRNMNQRNP